MGERGYLIYDVFTDRRLAGNPLAIVRDGAGLDTAAMQTIAREFNLSETVFLSPPRNPVHASAVRIFTPEYEMPFAGHPTVGAAIALSELRAAEDGEEMELLILEERIGNVRCVVSRHDGAWFAEFDLPRLPEVLQADLDDASIAAALGLGPHEIGFENHRPGLWSGGVPYVTVPVAGLEVAARARLDSNLWLEFAPSGNSDHAACAYVYCRETMNHDSAFHARMFVPGPPAWEDPATGSAVAALAGAIVHFDTPRDGARRYWIEQGVEMGRASRIRLEIETVDGKPRAARIGGHAVKLAEGTIFL